MKSKIIVLLAAFTIVASEGVGWANNVCWDMMVSSLKGGTCSSKITQTQQAIM
jgi:hypothetical protein